MKRIDIDGQRSAIHYAGTGSRYSITVDEPVFEVHKEVMQPCIRCSALTIFRTEGIDFRVPLWCRKVPDKIYFDSKTFSFWYNSKLRSGSIRVTRSQFERDPHAPIKQTDFSDWSVDVDHLAFNNVDMWGCFEQFTDPLLPVVSDKETIGYLSSYRKQIGEWARLSVTCDNASSVLTTDFDA